MVGSSKIKFLAKCRREIRHSFKRLQRSLINNSKFFSNIPDWNAIANSLSV